MFAKYKSRVLEEYKLRKNNNSISINLIHATPAKIKAECLFVLETRFEEKDKRILTTLFGQQNSESEYRNAIRKTDTDKFKPLANFLKGSTKSTDENNIELLAWLINYEPRPYQVNQPINTALHNSIAPVKANALPLDAERVKLESIRSKTGKAILASCIALFGLGLLYRFYTREAINQLYFPAIGQEQCMYWVGDRYKPVLCSLKMPDTPVFALDPEKIQRLRMITKPDTITKNSIGHLWYAKINGKLEFYTAGGNHPVYTNRRLKPLSLYMYTKYILYKK